MDISEYAKFHWYELVWYNNLGFEGSKFGRWLGSSHYISQVMSSKVLTEKGHIVG